MTGELARREEWDDHAKELVAQYAGFEAADNLSEAEKVISLLSLLPMALSVVEEARDTIERLNLAIERQDLEKRAFERRNAPKNECSIEGCPRPQHAKSYCKMHYLRAERHGDPLKIKRKQSPITLTDPDDILRFHGWTEKDSGCWEWDGPMNLATGYGLVTIKGKRQRVHRVAYETWVAPLDPGELVLHSCDNRCCISPEHLRSGSARDNMQDAISREHFRKKRTVRYDDLTVRAVRALREDGFTYAQIGSLLGVPESSVGSMARGEWAKGTIH